MEVAAKDPELLLAEKLSLEDEVQRLKAKVANLEQENFGKLSAIENPKEKLLQLFTAFDADKDGYLSGAELQDLAFQVDEVLPQSDLDRFAKEISGGQSNRIGFEQFFHWWSTPAQLEPNDKATNSGKLAIVQLKLQQPACISALLRVVQSLSFVAPLISSASKTTAATTITRADDSQKATTTPDVTKLPETVKVKVAVTMGHFEEPHSSARLSFERNRSKVAELEKEFGTLNGAAILEAQFLIKKKIEAEHLNKLKAETNQILTELRQPLKYALFSVKEKQADSDTPLLSVSVVWQDKSMLEGVRQLLAALDIRNLALLLELSQKPGDPVNGFARIRGDVAAEVNRLGLQYVITKCFSSESWATKSLMNMLTAFTDVNVSVGAHEITKLLKEVLKEGGPGPQLALVESWNALRHLIGPLMAELDADASVPRFIPNTYFAAVAALVGPQQVSVAFDDHLVQLKFEEFTVTNVLPSQAECDAIKNGEVEPWKPPAEEDDDKNDDDAPLPKGGGKKGAAEFDLDEFDDPF